MILRASGEFNHIAHVVIAPTYKSCIYSWDDPKVPSQWASWLAVSCHDQEHLTPLYSAAPSLSRPAMRGAAPWLDYQASLYCRDWTTKPLYRGRLFSNAVAKCMEILSNRLEAAFSDVLRILIRQ